MISIYQLKPRFQALLRPLVKWLYTHKITANQVTLFACAGSLLVAVLVAVLSRHHWLFALIPLWMPLRMALNAVDGMLAREFGQRSPLGAYLNELTDVVSDCALYLPFLFLPPVWNGLLLGVIFLAALSEYAGAMGPLLGASRRYDGPMGKSDRAFVFGALGLAVALGCPLSWLNYVLLAVAALLVYTLVNRIRRSIAEAKKAP